MCGTVIGNDIIDKKTLRECLGVDNTDDLLGKLITESPTPPKDDYTDEATGLPNSMLQRSTGSFERNEDGQIYYWIVDENGNKKVKLQILLRKKKKNWRRKDYLYKKQAKARNKSLYQ